jgi:hypothetical protein
MGSYGVGIGRAWCSRKACEICSSLVQKKKLKKNYFSSHKLPKQQSTRFWSQGILGVKQIFLFLKSRWPAEIDLVSFLDLPLCENVQKVQK